MKKIKFISLILIAVSFVLSVNMLFLTKKSVVYANNINYSANNFIDNITINGEGSAIIGSKTMQKLTDVSYNGIVLTGKTGTTFTFNNVIAFSKFNFTDLNNCDEFISLVVAPSGAASYTEDGVTNTCAAELKSILITLEDADNPSVKIETIIKSVECGLDSATAYKGVMSTRAITESFSQEFGAYQKSGRVNYLFKHADGYYQVGFSSNAIEPFKLIYNDNSLMTPCVVSSNNKATTVREYGNNYSNENIPVMTTPIERAKLSITFELYDNTDGFENVPLETSVVITSLAGYDLQSNSVLMEGISLKTSNVEVSSGESVNLSELIKINGKLENLSVNNQVLSDIKVKVNGIEVDDYNYTFTKAGENTVEFILSETTYTSKVVVLQTNPLINCNIVNGTGVILRQGVEIPIQNEYLLPDDVLMFKPTNSTKSDVKVIKINGKTIGNYTLNNGVISVSGNQYLQENSLEIEIEFSKKYTVSIFDELAEDKTAEYSVWTGDKFILPTINSTALCIGYGRENYGIYLENDEFFEDADSQYKLVDGLEFTVLYLQTTTKTQIKVGNSNVDTGLRFITEINKEDYEKIAKYSSDINFNIYATQETPLKLLNILDFNYNTVEIDEGKAQEYIVDNKLIFAFKRTISGKDYYLNVVKSSANLIDEQSISNNLAIMFTVFNVYESNYNQNYATFTTVTFKNVLGETITKQLTTTSNYSNSCLKDASNHLITNNIIHKDQVSQTHKYKLLINGEIKYCAYEIDTIKRIYEYANVDAVIENYN